MNENELAKTFASQNIIIEDRNRINVSGVKNVISFDDETVLLDTQLGRLTVKGDSIRIETFNKESGDLSASGKIFAAVYSSDNESGGFFSRLLR